jgi:hypothetical protein
MYIHLLLKFTKNLQKHLWVNKTYQDQHFAKFGANQEAFFDK